MSISSRSSPIIDYLPPDTSSTKQLKFSLIATRDSSIRYVIFNVAAESYQPEAKIILPISIEASSFHELEDQEKLIDGDYTTAWSSRGLYEWCTVELEDTLTPKFLKIAFKDCEDRQAIFDIYGSKDKLNWNVLGKDQTSCGYSNKTHVYDLISTGSSKQMKYITIVGKGNSIDERNSFSELRIYQNSSLSVLANPKIPNEGISIFPNPANEVLNIYVEKNGGNILSLYSVDGKILLKEFLTTGMNTIPISQIPIGSYIVNVKSEQNSLFSSSLIVQ